MTSFEMKGARRGLVALGAGILLALTPAYAQTAQESPGDALSRNLRSLAANPKSLHSLMGAGRAALELGDPQAAITFFARAENLAPRDGRIKMWIGSALVQLQQPRSALKFFKDAVDLGVAEHEVAKERGLAHDIMGNSQRAQADYRLALSRGNDDEVTRRLALSLAIAGQREQALKLLEVQLMVRDRAAERARAMILGLTGDSAGAARAAQASMPPHQAAAMAPFLARLASLNTTDRALAVHLGHFPGDGRPAVPQSYASANVTQAGRPDNGQPTLARRNPDPIPVSTAPRRRPGADIPATTAQIPASSPPVRRQAAVPQTPSTAANNVQTVPRADRLQTPAREIQLAQSAPARADEPPPTSLPGAQESSPVSSGSEAPAQTSSLAVGSNFSIGGTSAASAAPAQAPPVSSPTAQEARPIQVAELPPSDVQSSASALASAPSETAPAPVQPRQEDVRASNRLAEVAAAIAALPDPEPPARAAAAKPQKEEAKPASASTKRAAPAKPAPKKAAPAPPKEPSRHWVQVAGGANKTALPKTYATLKTKAPKLLGSRTAWTTPLNATNRLLVGPFGSSKEAQEFVNELAKADLSAFAWTSPAGQKIERLPAK